MPMPDEHPDRPPPDLCPGRLRARGEIEAHRARFVSALVCLLAGSFTVEAGSLTVQVVNLRREILREPLQRPGVLRPWEEVDLLARVAGYVREVRVDRGQQVKAGEVLLTIEAPELEVDLASARASLEEAQAAVAEKVAAAELAELVHQRWLEVRKMTPEGVPRHQVDEAAAKARVALKGVELAQAKSRSFETKVKHAEVLFDLTSVRAPFDGVIISRDVDPGARLPAGGDASGAARLFRLANISRLRLESTVPEVQSQSVSKGIPLEFALDSLGGAKFQGTVSRTAGVLDPASKTLVVEADVENPTGRIPAGAFARVRFLIGSEEPVLVAPFEAVFFDGGNPRVALIEGGRVIRRRVELGPNNGVWVELRGEGIREGSLLGYKLPATIPEGAEVEVIVIEPPGTSPKKSWKGE